MVYVNDRLNHQSLSTTSGGFRRLRYMSMVTIFPCALNFDRCQAIVFSEGDLYLDNCDFSGSSSSVLVYSEENCTAVIRNSVLGDNNCEQ